MNSMTGFGRAELKTKFGKFIVEISTVNNRFLEITPRLPRQFFSLEPKIREVIGNYLCRGKVHLYVGFEEPIDSVQNRLINKKVFKAYYQQLTNLKKELKSKSEIRIQDLLLLPDVTKLNNSDFDATRIWAGLKQTMTKALSSLVSMRRHEGNLMSKDMKKILTGLGKQIKKISGLSTSSVEKYRIKLNKRLNELLDAPIPNRVRLEEEIALMAERTDITEECSRFQSHLKQYQITLKDNKPMGKRLNFILQELNREANTIASKCSEINIASESIKIKEEIEKLRELVQNAE